MGLGDIMFSQMPYDSHLVTALTAEARLVYKEESFVFIRGLYNALYSPPKTVKFIIESLIAVNAPVALVFDIPVPVP